MDTKQIGRCSALASLLACSSGVALSAPVAFEALVSPKYEMRLDFADSSRHFVQMVRRDGRASGSGPLAGAEVTEHGFHDVRLGENADALGYLTFTSAEGSQAYVRWTIRAVFVPGAEGKPVLLNQGVWEVVDGSGKFAGLKGAGAIRIQFVSKTDRKFVLTGDLVPAR